ncbi:MAG TPA: DUF4129 domain-containing protein [Actinomycetales bacterium]|nr:DUF4129 domain-containing protein [Actinomycetales bacterium]
MSAPSLSSLVQTALPLAPPLDPGRDEARRWAWQELSDPVYAQHEPSWTERAILWLWRTLQNLELPAGPGGTGGLVILVALLLVLVLVIWFRTGPVRGSARRTPSAAVLQGTVRTAREHRALADAAAADGRWADAVRERFRAVVRTLEERGFVDQLPGRTAQEVAPDVAPALPDLVGRLHEAATVFDDVCYGSREALPQHDSMLRDLHDRVLTARPATAGATAGAST